MQGVPGQGLALPARPFGRAAAVLAAVAALAATASFVLPAHRVERVAPPHVAAAVPTGVPLQRARCMDWWHMSGDQKQALFDVLRGTVGGAVATGGHGTTLTDAQATRLFDSYCANRVASGFMLYALYARAAGFRIAPGTGL